MCFDSLSAQYASSSSLPEASCRLCNKTTPTLTTVPAGWLSLALQQCMEPHLHSKAVTLLHQLPAEPHLDHVQHLLAACVAQQCGTHHCTGPRTQLQNDSLNRQQRLTPLHRPPDSMQPSQHLPAAPHLYHVQHLLAGCVVQRDGAPQLPQQHLPPALAQQRHAGHVVGHHLLLPGLFSRRCGKKCRAAGG